MYAISPAVRKTLGAALVAFAMILFSLPALAAGDKAQVLSKEGIGSYLADSKGMTLYIFTKDSPGVSVCSGDCLVKWPAYAADKVEPGAGLNAKDFGVIKRADGSPQATFRGAPLYYFFKDQKPGDTSGQGVNEVWYVVNPAKK